MARRQGWNSNVAEVSARMLKAVDAGLRTAAEVYQGEMIKRLQYGYTSGKYVHGAGSAKHVTVGQPEWRDGKRSIAVGMPGNVDGTDYMYVLYWELGHLNLWSANYEHVPIWVPTLNEMAPQLREAFANSYNFAMNGSGR